MTQTVILPYTHVRTTPKDIEGLRTALSNRRSDIRLKTFPTDLVPAWLGLITGPQTVTVTMNNDPYLPIFDYVPGPKFFAPMLSKTQLLAALVQAGIPVPRSTRWKDDLQPDEESFGRYLAIKTTAPGSVRARGVVVCRTDRFNDLRPKLQEIFAADLAAGHLPVIQQYIPTGEKPTHTRVTTFLGAPVVCFRTQAPQSFDVSKLDGLAGGEATSNASDRRSNTLVDDPEMVALSDRICQVFRSTSVLSTDMVRCADTGKLYCLEVNLGNLGVLSSQIVGGLRQRLGEEAMHAQFGSYDTMARQIIKVLDGEY